MRILFVPVAGNVLSQDIIKGGVEKSSIHKIEVLKDDHELIVFAPNYSDNIDGVVSEYSSLHPRLNYPKGVSETAKYKKVRDKEILDIIDFYKPEMILVEMTKPIDVSFVYKVPEHIPIMIHVHQSFHPGSMSFFTKGLMEKLVTFSKLPNVTNFVVSDQVIENFKFCCEDEKIGKFTNITFDDTFISDHVIVPIYAEQILSSEIIDSLDESSWKRSFGVICRWDSQKNLSGIKKYVLRALKELPYNKLEQINLNFMVDVDDQSYIDFKEKISKIKGGEIVKFYENLPQKESYINLAGCDFVYHSGLIESFGITPIECSFLGIPGIVAKPKNGLNNVKENIIPEFSKYEGDSISADLFWANDWIQNVDGKELIEDLGKKYSKKSFKKSILDGIEICFEDIKGADYESD